MFVIKKHILGKHFKKTETTFSKYNKELSSDVDFIKNSTLFASPSGRITGNNQL